MSLDSTQIDLVAEMLARQLLTKINDEAKKESKKSGHNRLAEVVADLQKQKTPMESSVAMMFAITEQIRSASRSWLESIVAIFWPDQFDNARSVLLQVQVVLKNITPIGDILI